MGSQAQMKFSGGDIFGKKAPLLVIIIIFTDSEECTSDNFVIYKNTCDQIN